LERAAFGAVLFAVFLQTLHTADATQQLSRVGVSVGGVYWTLGNRWLSLPVTS